MLLIPMLSRRYILLMYSESFPLVHVASTHSCFGTFCSFFGKDDIYYPQGIKHCNGESQFIDVFPMAKPAVSWRISQI